MKTHSREFKAALRQDLSSFTKMTFRTIDPGTRYMHNWHIDAIAWQLMRVYRGEINRLVITIPPRYLKSITASVAFVAWVLGHDPSRQILCASYSQDLAKKHARGTRSVMEENWYRHTFPGTQLSKDKKSESEFETTKHGVRLATSVDGTLTGRGGSIIIIDDPHKAEEALSETSRNHVIDWYQTTLSSRLNNKKEDAIILIQQRLHQGDLAGYLLEASDWSHLNLPAIADEAQSIQIGPDKFMHRAVGDVLHLAREPIDVLDQLKRDLGSYHFAAQYQQRPAPLGGGLVKWDWFQCYDTPPEFVQGDEIMQSWDTALKADAQNDYSVCTTWLLKEPHYYLLHVYRKQLEFPDLQRQVVDHAKAWNATRVLIEEMGSGISLIQHLYRKSVLNVIAIHPESDKVTRMMTATPLIEGKRVFIPAEATWLADFQYEIVNFPKAKHDDQVDSVSQFLNWTKNHSWPSDWSTIMEINASIPRLTAIANEDVYLTYGIDDDGFR